MAKFKFYVNTGYVGSDREEVIEIPDEELEGLTEQQKEKMMEEEFWNFMSNNCDYGWYEMEEDEEE
jgi:hypothetical protein